MWEQNVIETLPATAIIPEAENGVEKVVGKENSIEMDLIGTLLTLPVTEDVGARTIQKIVGFKERPLFAAVERVKKVARPSMTKAATKDKVKHEQKETRNKDIRDGNSRGHSSSRKTISKREARSRQYASETDDDEPPTPRRLRRDSNKKQRVPKQLKIPSKQRIIYPNIKEICSYALGCKEKGNGRYPCPRCHLEYYCSDKHQKADAEPHQKFCKTNSYLEVISDNVDYSVWVQFSAPILYDVLLNFILVWPSLTVQFLPEKEKISDKFTRYKILIGTQTSGEQNYVLLCALDVSNTAKVCGELTVLKRINHLGHVHRARYNPKKPSIVATKSASVHVNIFDLASFPDLPVDDYSTPTIWLEGHTKDGYGLSWSPHEEGKLVSGSNDGLVCLWDINALPYPNKSKGSVLKCHTTLKKHTAVVEDVCWHPTLENIIGSCGDDKRLLIWDIRQPNEPGSSVENAHNNDVNAISFSPFASNLLATGGADDIVLIWDMRTLKKPIQNFTSKGIVLQVQWSPNNPSLVASSGCDRAVSIWDIENSAKSEREQNSAVQKVGEQKNKLSFIHGGHVSTVCDIAWCPVEDGMLASVSEDNIIQVWKMGKNLPKVSNFKEET